MRISEALLLALFLVTAGCGGSDDSPATGSESESEAAGAPAAPEEPPPPNAQTIAEQYMRSAEDEAGARELLDPGCHANEGMVRVDAARVMGAPITIEELTVTPQEEAEDVSSVRYEISGSAHGEGTTTEILGIQVRAGEVNVDNANQSGVLNLRRIDGQWRVTCAGATGEEPTRVTIG